jgi:hypothetical protein
MRRLFQTTPITVLMNAAVQTLREAKLVSCGRTYAAARQVYRW